MPLKRMLNDSRAFEPEAVALLRIAITQAAFEAIAATLPSSVGFEAQRAPNGD